MWDLPEPGLEPVSPALAGGFLTTAPPGKSWEPVLMAAPRSIFQPVRKAVPLEAQAGDRSMS